MPIDKLVKIVVPTVSISYKKDLRALFNIVGILSMNLSTLRHTLLCLLLLVSAPLFAQNTEPSPDIDPFVVQLVKQASDYLANYKSFSVQSDATMEEVLADGQKIQLSRMSRALVRRPDRMYAEVITDQETNRFYYNGKQMSRFDLDKNVYASIKVPGTLDKALDHAMEKYQLDAPLADFLTGNLYGNFIANTRAGFYAGLHYMQGKKHHHLAMSNENVDFQVWIADGVAPLIHKVVITYQHLPGEPQFVAHLSAWDFSPQTPDMVFEFYPPIDADEIQFLPVKTAEGKK